ncbi:MAG TPA: peptidylprolyl isomerase [Fimbriimonas sp.]|nr:peptidylprolyl isomerase [Fimbriimonas sp.]
MPATLSLIALTAFAAPSFPIQADFTYNGVNRPFMVRVDAVRGAKKLTLRLVKPADGKLVEEVEVKRGKVDVSKAFKTFWSKPHTEVLYLQRAGDGKANGPALVLQPMTNSAVCTLDEATKNPKWTPDEDNTYAGVRCWVDQNVVLDTEFGEAEFKMRPDCAPNTVWNFMELIKGGYYRDVIFHRIVQKHPRTGKKFVIQAGDPTGTGSGSPGYSFILEKSPLPHDYGVLGMARSTDPNTNGSQFYVALSREATQHLDGRYVTYGQLVRGKDVIDKISSVEIGPKDDRPVKPPVIRSARLVNPKDH